MYKLVQLRSAVVCMYWPYTGSLFSAQIKQIYWFPEAEVCLADMCVQQLLKSL